MSKFFQDDGVPDTLNDTIGALGRAICSQPYFNAEAFRLKAELIKCLSAQRYTGFTANVTNYGTWGVGVSRLYFVPKDRRGALSAYREQTIRLICVGSGRYTRELMAGVVDADRKLTSWRCGGKVGLLGGSSCTHTKTEFEQLSFISSPIRRRLQLGDFRLNQLGEHGRPSLE